MINLAVRNLKIFFRDKSSVFFSFLSVIIIIGLYVLFLGDVITSDMDGLPGVRFLMDSWIASGLMAVTSITSTMGAFGIMVEDRARKNNRDFLTAPLKRSTIAGGYVVSTYLIGVIISLVTLVLIELYIVAYGGSLLPFTSLLKVVGLILLSVLSSSAMVFFITSFFKSMNAFSTASTILGTLIGFLTGIYIPIGVLPESIGWVIKLFPVSHAALLFRHVFMAEPMSATFANVPESVVAAFNTEMGMVFQYGEYTATPLVHLIVLIAVDIVFFLLSVWSISRKRKG